MSNYERFKFDNKAKQQIKEKKIKEFFDSI